MLYIVAVVAGVLFGMFITARWANADARTQAAAFRMTFLVMAAENHEQQAIIGRLEARLDGRSVTLQDEYSMPVEMPTETLT